MGAINKLGMEGRKWEIFESAVYLFAQNGYENVSMREIAAENNIRASSLYNYFPSKSTLLSLMYELFYVNTRDVEPDLQAWFDMIPHCEPKEMLFNCMSNYDPELQPIMDCIMIVAVSQANHDQEAYQMIRHNIFEHTNAFLRPVLQKMLDCQLIEPLDIEAFLRLYTSLAFTALLRERTPDAIGNEGWARTLDLLFSLPRPVKKEGSATNAQ